MTAGSGQSLIQSVFVSSICAYITHIYPKFNLLIIYSRFAPYFSLSLPAGRFVSFVTHVVYFHSYERAFRKASEPVVIYLKYGKQTKQKCSSAHLLSFKKYHNLFCCHFQMVRTHFEQNTVYTRAQEFVSFVQLWIWLSREQIVTADYMRHSWSV